MGFQLSPVWKDSVKIKAEDVLKAFLVQKLVIWTMPPRYQGFPFPSSSLSVLSEDEHSMEHGEGYQKQMGKAIGPRVRTDGALDRMSTASVYIPLHSLPLLVLLVTMPQVSSRKQRNDGKVMVLTGWSQGSWDGCGMDQKDRFFPSPSFPNSRFQIFVCKSVSLNVESHSRMAIGSCPSKRVLHIHCDIWKIDGF